MDREKLRMAIEDCLDEINDDETNAQQRGNQIQALEILSRIENECDKTEAEIRKGKEEVKVKKQDVWSKAALSLTSLLASLGVMRMIKDIETTSTVSTKMFPMALNGIQKVFRL